MLFIKKSVQYRYTVNKKRTSKQCHILVTKKGIENNQTVLSSKFWGQNLPSLNFSRKSKKNFPWTLVSLKLICRAVDPDPHGSAFNMRIRNQEGNFFK